MKKKIQPPHNPVRRAVGDSKGRSSDSIQTCSSVFPNGAGVINIVDTAAPPSDAGGCVWLLSRPCGRMASHEKGYTAPGSVADSHCIPVLARRHRASCAMPAGTFCRCKIITFFPFSAEKPPSSACFLTKIKCRWSLSVYLALIV